MIITLRWDLHTVVNKAFCDSINFITLLFNKSRRSVGKHLKFLFWPWIDFLIILELIDHYRWEFCEELWISWLVRNILLIMYVTWCYRSFFSSRHDRLSLLIYVKVPFFGWIQAKATINMQFDTSSDSCTFVCLNFLLVLRRPYKIYLDLHYYDYSREGIELST